jgi:hypothetical protein
MKVANENRKTQTTWLRTTDPVVPVKSSETITAAMKNFLAALHSALAQGVEVIPDRRRLGFYEIEIGDCWYYIHIPDRLARVYLVATGRNPMSTAPFLMSAAHR